MIWKALGVVLVVFAFTTMPARAAGPESISVTDIGNELVCQCGCTMILSNCSHLECHSREEMTAFIVQELDRGQTGNQIIQAFVSQYGEQVLASPPKKGLNLVAWILPFVAILAGGVVVYLALKKWVWQGNQAAANANFGAGKIYDEYRQRIERELQEFDGSGFR